MELKKKYSQFTIARRVMFAVGVLRKNQLDEICHAIDLIDFDRRLDDDEEAQIQLMALKILKRRLLAAWRQSRTKNGLSNEALEGA